MSTTISWICQSFSNCHKKAIFCLLVNCFTVLFVLYDIQFTYDLDINSYSDFNNMNTIFITYFLSVSFVKCCIQMKGYIQYCLDGFYWAFRSWPNPGTTIPTWECGTCCSPVWIWYINPQITHWKNPMCANVHSKLPVASGMIEAVGHDGVSDSWKQKVKISHYVSFPSPTFP